MRVEEKIVIDVSIVLNLNFALITIQIWEVAIRAGREALCSPLAILRDLLIEGIVAHHCHCGHGTDWPEKET